MRDFTGLSRARVASSKQLIVCDTLEPRKLLTAVTGASPLNGAAAVPVASNLTVTFDVAVNASSVNGSTIQLRNAANQIVPAAVTYDAFTGTATLNPNANLAATNTYYFARVLGGASGVKDTNGNALPADFNWSFTTGTPQFTEQTVFSGLTSPTAIEFSPDGRVFVAEKSGIIKVFDGVNDTTPTIFADLRTNTHNYWDRGLLGMALDPQFTTGRPYVYVLYTYDGNIGGPAPVWGSVGGTSDGGGSSPTGTGTNVSGRLSRLTVGANGVMTGSEVVLIHDWVNQFPSHSIGHLAFGPDGMLYASSGDGASFNFVDTGQVGNPFNDPAGEGGAVRSQDVRSTGDPTGLDGSIIRINPDSGAAAPGNPITTGDADAKRIVAYGLRNPMRFTFRPGTSEIWVGDVGWNTWEEINRLGAPADSTADNFGWPAFEGPNRQSGYDAANVPLLESLYAAGGDVKPFYAYQHSAKVVATSSEPTGGSSITGISFYNGGTYPTAFDGALFFTDYSRRYLYVMHKGPSGLPDVASRQVFKALPGGAVELTTGPNGDLFYVDHNNGRVQRFTASGTTNARPTAAITADKTTGGVPLAVNFSAVGSTDPDAGDTLTYAWDLDNDGAFDDATGVTASRTYTSSGIYTASVRVTDRAGLSHTASIQINAANTVPVPIISSPTASLNWHVGQVVTFTGSATDVEDGTLAASNLTWSLVLIHANAQTGSTHDHVIQTFAGVSSGSFVTPDHEYPSWLELRLTATDSVGLMATKTLRLDPQTVSVTIASNPAGGTLTLNGETLTSPFSRTVIAGSSNSVSAPAQQTINGVPYTFRRWSDQGVATHNFFAPSTISSYTLTANYDATVDTILINAGGAASGSYAADNSFAGGTTFSTTSAVDLGGASNPAPMNAYQTERTGTSFSYQLSELTPGQSYTLRLHFAEIWWTSAGQRSFNVAVNGSSVLSNFDVFAAAGGANKAVVRSFTAVADSAGQVTVAFTTNLDQAKVSAIELIPLQQVSSVMIHAGGGAVGSFAADDFYTGGTTFSTAAAISTSGVVNAAPAAVYQTERTGTSFGYNIDGLVPSGAYTVRLHFAEIWWTAAGQRRFSVTINGQPALTNLDVVAAAGGINKALVRTFTATANSAGVIAINFAASIDQAKISGIEIIPATGGLPAAPANLNASAAPGQVLLSWNTVAGATNYRVYRATTPGGQGSTPIASNVTGTTYTDNTVADGTTYYYVVTAVNGSGESTPSNEASTTTRRSTALIDSGGNGTGDFAPDGSFTGGGTFAVTDAVSTAGVANAAPASVYQTERYGNVTYSVAGLTPDAATTVRLHFSEIWWTAPGQRLFNVSINGQQVLANFDVFAQAGGRLKALVKEFAATANSAGVVTIQFQTVLDNATTAGIEILAAGTGTSSQSSVMASLWASGASTSAEPEPTRRLTKAEKRAAKRLEQAMKRQAKREAAEQKRLERQALVAQRKADRAQKRQQRLLTPRQP